MKERQREAGGDKVSVNAKTAVDHLNHSGDDKTTKRKELAKIAGTSGGGREARVTSQCGENLMLLCES